MDEKLASITELAELYNKLDAMGKGMLLGWATALKWSLSCRIAIRARDTHQSNEDAEDDIGRPKKNADAKRV